MWPCSKFIITKKLLTWVHLSYFSRNLGDWRNNKGLMRCTAMFLYGSWRVNIWCVINFLYFLTLEIELILVFFYFFIPHQSLSCQFRRYLSQYYHYRDFALLLLLLLSVMPIVSRTWTFLDMGTVKNKFWYF